MAYNKTTWQNGDTITAEKLNNMENGIANLPIMIVTVHEEDIGGDYSDMTDYSSSEIIAAIDAGKLVFVNYYNTWLMASKELDGSNSVLLTSGIVQNPVQGESHVGDIAIEKARISGHDVIGSHLVWLKPID